MFVALTAVDIGGKCNFELTFPLVPTIAELREKIISVCTAESAIRRPSAPLFEFHRAQVFDERMDMWVDLVASSQLEDYCQIYVFQRESQWHKDTPGRIPPPTKPAVHSSHPGHEYKDQMSIAASIANIAVSHTRAPSLTPPMAYSPASALHHVEPVAPVMHSQFTDRSHIPYSDKVRQVYDELDTQHTRAVTLEEWQQGCERLRLTSAQGLTAETCLDLFQKTDLNEDGVVSFTEFQYFAELYPKIVDSMHFRAKHYHQELVRKQRMSQQQDILEELEAHHETAKQATLDAELEADSGKAKIDECDAEVERAEAEEKEAGDAKFEAGKVSEEMRTSLRDMKSTQASAREAYKKIEIAKKTAERGIEMMNKKVKQQESDRDRSAKELERLQRLVQDQQRDLDRKEKAITDSQVQIQEAQEKAQQIDDPQLEAQRNEADEAVARAEEDLKRSVELEAELLKEHKAKQRGVQTAVAGKQTVLRESQEVLSMHTLRKEAESRSAQQLELHRANVEKVRDIESETDMKREEEEAKENELLQMEVRLREQREAMEKKEEALRTAHLSFTEETGRVSPRRY